MFASFAFTIFEESIIQYHIKDDVYQEFTKYNKSAGTISFLVSGSTFAANAAGAIDTYIDRPRRPEHCGAIPRCAGPEFEGRPVCDR